MIFIDETIYELPKNGNETLKSDRKEPKNDSKMLSDAEIGHEIGRLWIETLKNAICDRVKCERPEMSDKEILKGFEEGRIRLICARNSNWPFGKPYLPPIVEFD